MLARSVPLGVFATFDEHLCELVGVVASDFGNHLSSFLVAASQAVAQQLGFYILILEQLFKYVLNIIDLCPALQHTAKVAVLLVHNGLVEDVAVEGGIGVERCHALYLHSWPVQQHSPEAASLGTNVYLTRF